MTDSEQFQASLKVSVLYLSWCIILPFLLLAFWLCSLTEVVIHHASSQYPLPKLH